MIDTYYVKVGGFVGCIQSNTLDPIATIQRLALQELGVKVGRNVAQAVWAQALAEKERRLARSVVKSKNIHHAFLELEEVAVGKSFSDHINQGERDCEVLEVSGNRYRIGYELPNVMKEAWRTGVRVGGKLFRSVVG